MFDDIDRAMNCFRIASRELFFHFFHCTSDVHESISEHFKEVEEVLFEKLVIAPLQIGNVRYGEANKEIGVTIRHGASAPIWINREVESGYWDHPVKEIRNDVGMSFISFFDFDTSRYIDNQYVEVRIESCPANTDVIRRHALIENQYVKFFRECPDK